MKTSNLLIIIGLASGLFLTACGPKTDGIHRVTTADGCAYVDADSILVDHPVYGYAREEHTFDSGGRKTGCAFFSADGLPVFSKHYGYARVEHTYDRQGNETCRAFFDADGRPVVSKPHYTPSDYHYDSWEGIHAFYLATECLTGNRAGCARWEATYDALGRLISCARYGADGRLMAEDETKIARMERTYGSAGHEDRIAFYDACDRLADNRRCGWARFERTCDSTGHMIRYAFYDSEGQPAADKLWGCAREELTYDAYGREVSRAFFSAEGRPANFMRWCARMETTYPPEDDLDPVITYYDAKGRVLGGDSGPRSALRPLVPGVYAGLMAVLVLLLVWAFFRRGRGHLRPFLKQAVPCFLLAAAMPTVALVFALAYNIPCYPVIVPILLMAYVVSGSGSVGMFAVFLEVFRLIFGVILVCLAFKYSVWVGLLGLLLLLIVAAVWVLFLYKVIGR